MPFRSEKKGNERSCQEEEKEGPMGRLPGEKMNHIRLWKVVEGMNVGDEKLPNLCGNYSEPLSNNEYFMESIQEIFFYFYFSCGGQWKVERVFCFFSWLTMNQTHSEDTRPEKTNSKRPPENRLKPKRR